MIKFTAGGLGDSLLLGFGLSRGNINQLVKGHPIKADLKELGLENTTILIFFGETEEQMQKDLAKMLGPSTLIVDRKRGVEN